MNRCVIHHIWNGYLSERRMPDAGRLAPTDGHNSLWIMSAPTTGVSGDGDSDRGRALHKGDESGPDFMVFMTSRR
jgi:hypothetical protein